MAKMRMDTQRAGVTSSWSNRNDSLLRAIEGEIIPRLLSAHQRIRASDSLSVAKRGHLTPDNDDQLVERSEDGTPAVDLAGVFDPVVFGGAASTVTSTVIAEFVRILLHHDPDVATSFVEMQHARGVSMPDLLLDLCAPAARKLGEMWASDDCSFCDVTIGLSSLEHVITRCANVRHESLAPVDPNKSILLGLVPGTQHVFGLLIIKDLFKRAGWTVNTPAGSGAEALLESVRTKSVSVVGLTVGTTEDLPACQRLIQNLRRESRNPNVLIVVGGYGIQQATQSTRLLDADLLARDGREGLDQIQRMISRLDTRAAASGN